MLGHRSEPGDGRSIGLIGAISIGIGGMVGGGIFAVLGVAAESAGGATPLAFLFAGGIAGLTAYSYTKLSVTHQSAGGTVAFVDSVFGVSDITGSLNVVLWAGYIATTALYAKAFGNYAASLLPGGADSGNLLVRALILVGVALPWVINLTNAGLIARSEGVVVAVKMTILLVVVAAGVPTVSTQRLAVSTWPSPLGILGAGMLIFVAYEGFELIANSSADIVRPERNLPRAFGFSVGIVVIVYLAISAVVVGSMSPEEIRKAADFALAQAASASLGRFGFVLVGLSAVLATFSAINATLFGSARLSYTLASEGELPDLLEKSTLNEPMGLHITALMGLAIAVALPLDAISSLSSAIFLIVFAVVNLAGLKSVRSTTGRVICAAGVLGCIGSLVVLVGRSTSDQPSAVIALVVMLVLALGSEHLLLKRWRLAG
ncbi:MAG: APC family permease [Acidimicrobiia bacterium]